MALVNYSSSNGRRSSKSIKNNDVDLYNLLSLLKAYIIVNEPREQELH